MGSSFPINVFLDNNISKKHNNLIFFVRGVFLSVRIYAVSAGSPAEKAGILPGEILLSVNGEEIIDEIDYQALTSLNTLHLQVLSGQDIKNIQIIKTDWEPLGLCLDETESMKPRHCRNKCIFCFVDQLPDGMRDTLYIKDDDWRLSMMMGNYVTLTNVNEQEFDRILARKASPLYISVHATDPNIRCRMLHNPSAGSLMDRLNRMRDHGLQFHAQVVLCPGVNDGLILEKTIEDLASLYPCSQSLAIVPVGLTKHRDNLFKLTRFDSGSAYKVIRLVNTYQDRFLKDLGTRFVYPSDEFYCLCHEKIPANEYYEDYPQIENGVGMLRLLEQECNEAFDYMKAEMPSEPFPRSFLIPTGVSAHSFIQKIVSRYAPPKTKTTVIAIHNTFFGESITVTGLIVGRDLIEQLKDINCDQILLCDTMLREGTDRFLDDTTIDDVRKSLGKQIRVVRNNGESLIRALWGMEDSNG